jgi:cob(I)alamin adenosyltransferase
MSKRIYTRSGDTGDTGLFGGQRVRKDDVRVEAYGTVDELNALLGVALSVSHDSDLARLITHIQHDLFSLGADLATPESAGEKHGRASIERVSGEMVSALESEIDRLEADLAPLTRFILPGGGALGAHLHQARTVCRRAERRCVRVLISETANPNIIRYLNRLSDLLFVMARAANAHAGVADIPWIPRG